KHKSFLATALHHTERKFKRRQASNGIPCASSGSSHLLRPPRHLHRPIPGLLPHRDAPVHHRHPSDRVIPTSRLLASSGRHAAASHPSSGLHAATSHASSVATPPPATPPAVTPATPPPVSTPSPTPSSTPTGAPAPSTSPASSPSPSPSKTPTPAPAPGTSTPADGGSGAYVHGVSMGVVALLGGVALLV
ncbi:unnamed protein product, partial [Musa acuminata var. zebrina]